MGWSWFLKRGDGTIGMEKNDDTWANLLYMESGRQEYIFYHGRDGPDKLFFQVENGQRCFFKYYKDADAEMGHKITKEELRDQYMRYL